MTSKPSRLLLFTNAFPCGGFESFLETELVALADAFDAITILPKQYAGKREPRPVPENVTVLAPLLERDDRRWLIRRGLWNRAPVGFMFREWAAKRVYRKRRWLVGWAEASFLIRALLANRGMMEVIRSAEPSTLFYFYWSSGLAWALPFLDVENMAVSRFHGFDLYENRRDIGGYIPYRDLFLQRLDQGFCVSEDGEAYLKRRYSDLRWQPRVARLGVPDGGRTPHATDGTIRLVTCSRTVALKRLDLLVEALRELSGRVEWTHLGDGPLQEEVKAWAASLPSNIACCFRGDIPNTEVLRLYARRRIDAFVNISTTEGAPVSVMEALAAGIPVIATAAGGTAELVDNTVGRLLPVDLSSRQVAEAIEWVTADPERWKAMSNRAHARWQTIADARRNYRAFAQRLLDLKR